MTNPIIFLNKEKIEAGLNNTSFKKPFNLHVFDTIDSTNKFLKELPPSQNIEICTAEQQTQGRGRFGRNWHSPYGENIYCSLRWNVNGDLNKLSGLSLVCSLAVVNALKDFISMDEIKVKWPNDILWKGKKLCGILIEILSDSNASPQIIIGIGLNVNSETQTNPLPDKEWCSLYEIAEIQFDRNIILVSILANLELYLNRFRDYNFDLFMLEWNEYDFLFERNITVINQIHTISGVACGVDQIGQLIVKDNTGTRHYLSSGETSITFL